MRFPKILWPVVLPALFAASFAWAAAVYDVTDKVAAAVKGNALRIEATNVRFGDPAHGRQKQLRVEYSQGERVLTNAAAEKSVLTIEAQPGKRLIILKATYGVH